MQRLLFCFAMICHLHSDEVVVHLSTTTELPTNVYLAKLRPCETPYEQALNEVLHTDLAFFDKERLIEIDEMMQFHAHHPDPSIGFQANWWKSLGARFVVVPRIEKQALHFQVFDVATATLKTLTPIALSQSIAKDLHVIHKASDLITKIVFNKDGITSKRILYAYQAKEAIEGDDSWRSEIWEMDYDGKNRRQLTQENSYSITPAFVPNRKNPENYAFLYVTYKQGPPRIYISSRNRLKGVPLIPLRGNQLLPTLAPTQDKIAFISDASGRADLFIQPYNPEKGAVGKPVQLYSFPSSVQASPSFHPDGTKIAFVSDKSGTPKIYLIDATQGTKTPEPKLLSKVTHDSSSPSWSPDGKKIAFSSKTNGVRQIWIYDIEEGKESQITSGVGNKENPSWAPDSLHLVYNTTSPTHDIFMINLDQPTPVRLTDEAGIKHYPVFEQ